MYSKTSATPSPVLAEVKKSLGPRSGGGGNNRGGGGGEKTGEDDGDGVVGSRLSEVLMFDDEPRSRAYILGVIVGALPELELPEERVLSLRCLKLDVGLVGSDKDSGSGDERAE